MFSLLVDTGCAPGSEEGGDVDVDDVATMCAIAITFFFTFLSLLSFFFSKVDDDKRLWTMSLRNLESINNEE